MPCPYRLFENDRFMMFYCWRPREIFLDIVSPDCEIRRISESIRMILNVFPPHQKTVASRTFDGSLELNTQAPFRAHNEFAALRHSALECCARPLFYLDLRDFQNHHSFLSVQPRIVAPASRRRFCLLPESRNPPARRRRHEIPLFRANLDRSVPIGVPDTRNRKR